ncbi:MAG TPA: hypothetical protein VNR87_16750 [Flavisolibacter sp.]|nr:hypothetical protein [Flavisolibacter sp.]
MKKIFFILTAFSAFCLASCEQDDSPGDNYDFSNSLPPYVALSSTATKTVKQGGSTTFTFQTRTAMQQQITVTYNVTGAVTLNNQTVVIDRDKTSAVATVNIPNGVIVPPATSATATLTLVKAVTADGRELTLGQKNNPASQKVTINITQ